MLAPVTERFQRHHHIINLLTQYDCVFHLNADTIVIDPIKLSLYSRDFCLIFTTDPNMVSYKGADKMPVQGGFLVIRPSEQDYSNLINIVITTDFHKGSGWNRTQIG
eukprot:gene30922-38215_t